MKTTAEEVRKALETILSDTQAYATTLNYAVLRCQQALAAPDDELRDRLMYITGNMVQWRHPKAKNVRAVFKSFIKQGGC